MVNDANSITSDVISSFSDAEEAMSSSSSRFPTSSLSSIRVCDIVLPHGRTEPMLGFHSCQVSSLTREEVRMDVDSSQWGVLRSECTYQYL